jgi:hypothetical protein
VEHSLGAAGTMVRDGCCTFSLLTQSNWVYNLYLILLFLMRLRDHLFQIVIHIRRYLSKLKFPFYINNHLSQRVSFPTLYIEFPKGNISKVGNEWIIDVTLKAPLGFFFVKRVNVYEYMSMNLFNQTSVWPLIVVFICNTNIL